MLSLNMPRPRLQLQHSRPRIELVVWSWSTFNLVISLQILHLFNCFAASISYSCKSIPYQYFNCAFRFLLGLSVCLCLWYSETQFLHWCFLYLAFLLNSSIGFNRLHFLQCFSSITNLYHERNSHG